MDLIRKILLSLEERKENVAGSLSIEGYSQEEIAYQCSLLNDAGFVKCYKGSYAGGHLYTFGVGSLTWDGTEFLDKIRNDTVWNKTKEVMNEKGLPVALDVIKAVVTSIVQGMIKGALGQ